MTRTKKLGATLVTGSLAAAIALAGRDYQRWKALGEGQIPWGLRGWTQVTAVRVRLRAVDPLDVTHLPAGRAHPALRGLPQRASRPRIAPHPVPHRQLDQTASPEMMAQLETVFAKELARREGAVEERMSEYERHHSALYARALAESGHSPGGEVAHFHRQDGSMHMHFNPADARLVIERGWGEFHRLSGRQHGVPPTYVLVYAPRDQEELAIVQTILEVTLDWATGVSS